MNSDAPITTDEFARLMAPFAVPAGARVAVAVSGGADSLALALLMKAWGDALGVGVIALTVDHRLRPEAEREARQVGDWLQAYDLDHYILTWQDGPATQSGIQARARDARYGLMADWCRANGVRHLFLAHHLGDQAETFLMRLKRGSTLHGLAAMTAKRDLGGGVTLCRPLLDVPKARLVAGLEALGQPWIEDPSNQNPAFERVRTRALIRHLKAEGVTTARLSGAARGARQVTEILDRAVAAFERRAVERREGEIAIDARALGDLPGPVAERLMALILTDVGGRDYPPAPDKVSRLTRAIGRADFRARTLGGCEVRLERDGLTIRPERARRADLRAF